jgi:SAM-dependent methyltransferase
MNYTREDFAGLFGLAVEKFPEACRRFVDTLDFEYEIPEAKVRDEIVLRVLKHIDSDQPTRVGPHRHDIWERCWSENLESFVSGGHDFEKLVPKFIKPGQPMRLNRNYVFPRNPQFELDFFQVCRAFLFDRYFADAKSVYEFGCGSGFNLVALSQQFPQIRLYGLDWSKSSYEMVDMLAKSHGLKIKGMPFNFFEPDCGLNLDAGSGVLTMCALEQVGPRHESFVDFLLEKKPKICVNMEPLLDLYDENDLVDYLAMRYHRKRGYLEGYLSRLKDLESRGNVEILEIRRFFFGSLFHECYSYVAWRPR